jgi:hypothetical protein
MIVAAVEFGRELTPALIASTPPTARFAAMVGGDTGPAHSYSSKEQFFRDCLDISRSIVGQAQPTSRREAFDARCGRAATESVGAMPLYARGWLVLAALAKAAGNEAGFADDLIRAFRAAPHAHYLAQTRVALVGADYGQSREDVQALYRSDIVTLLSGMAGRDLVAARFIDFPNERPAIRAALDGATANEQAGFLAALKARGVEGSP